MHHPKHRSSKTLRLRLLSLTVAGVLNAPLAQAEEAGGAAATNAINRLDTVTVTAERREERIKDVPLAVSTLSGEKLDVLNSSGTDIRFLSGRVPSLLIESSFGRAFPRFYIRGLGNTDFDLNASQPVSLVYDDVVQESPILKGFPVFDLDRIEVLRGPQGTLFGRNSPAGVVRFESARPQFREDAYGSVSWGRFNTVNLEGAYNTPVNATTAVRISVSGQHRDNWVDNTYPGPTQHLEGYDDTAARFQLLFKPSADFSALANLHLRDLSGSARLFRANIIQKGTNDLVSGFDASKISIDGQNGQSVRSLGGSLRLQWDLPHVSLHSITGIETVKSYSRGDVDGGYGAAFLPTGSGPGVIPFPSQTADGLPSHQQLSQEIRVQSRDAGPWQWLAGLYYFQEGIRIDSFDYDTLAGGAQDGYARQHQQTDSAAVFGSMDYAVSPSLKLRAGLRYTNDRKTFEAQRLVSPIGGGATAELTANPSASNTSGDLSATYALSGTTNVYARVSTGYRAPSIQGRLLFSDTISTAKAETVESYEAGIKTESNDQRLRASFNVFQYTVHDQQLTAVGGQSNATTLINAAKSEGEGFEFDLQAAPIDQLLLTANASYNHTRIRDPNIAVFPCAACTVTSPAGASPGTVSINGNPLPQAPEWIGNITARYGMPLANGEAFVYTDWSYRSKVNFFLYESKEFTGKSLLEGGLRAGYNWSNGRYEAAAFVRNLTNTTRVVGGIDFNNLTGFINEPRTFGLAFRAAM